MWENTATRHFLVLLGSLEVLGSDAGEEIAAIFWAPKSPCPPKSLTILSLRRKITSDCDFCRFCDLFRTYWIGANPEKISLVNSRGPDWRQFSELCALLFFLGKTHKMLAKIQFSKPIFGHPAGQLERPHCKQFQFWCSQIRSGSPRLLQGVRLAWRTPGWMQTYLDLREQKYTRILD